MYRVYAIFIGGLVLYLCFLLLYQFTFPQTYIGTLNVSLHPFKKISEVVTKLQEEKIQLQVQDRVYTYSYADLGIQINSQAIQEFTDQKNEYPWVLFSQLIQQIFTIKQYDHPFVFTDKYYAFAENTVFDFSKVPAVTIDPEDKRIIYSPPIQYKIDAPKLQHQLLASAGSKIPIVAAITPVDDVKGVHIENYNARIKRTYETPISIKVKEIPEVLIIVTTEEIKHFLSIVPDSEQNTYEIDVDADSFSQIMLKKHELFQTGDKRINLEILEQEMITLLRQRMDGIYTETLLTNLHTSPNTDGTRAMKYIEVDISQQKMYLFENGKTIATHGISSGLYYPTPVGEFKIMNKAPNAYSNIYNVWMPYWMAFYYGPDVRAYFGIHELPYWVSEDGSKHQRPREFIGSPRTGGCVALDVGVAQAVYAFADIGMPVLIFE